MFDFDKSFTIFLDNFDLFWYGTKITIIFGISWNNSGFNNWTAIWSDSCNNDRY